ncbi:hypothetical protein L7F22_006537 [Adiantum nelumboides]|nr:hypothetical protein [Adiantum nelumboides]
MVTMGNNVNQMRSLSLFPKNLQEQVELQKGLFQLPLISDFGEPESYEEAIQHESKEEWTKSMQVEMDSLHHNQTWELVEWLKDKRAFQNKWVYKLKEDEGGKKRYKSRLVVKGFSQKKGIDFNEIFSPVIKMNSIKLVLSLVDAHDLNLEGIAPL